jgi:hypothetical protein
MGVSMTGSKVVAQTAPEYEIKAAVLYKLASFVSWPADRDSEAICIGVIGKDPFGRFLDQGAQGRTINGREVHVERFQSVSEVGHCQILFISASEGRRLRETLAPLRGKPILTVGDVAGFCESGGIINLKVTDSGLRLEINVEAGQQTGLQFSYKLLRLAKIVQGSRQ